MFTLPSRGGSQMQPLRGEFSATRRSGKLLGLDQLSLRHDRGDGLEAAPLGPIDDLEAAVEMLDQGGAAFHPVAVVAVKHPVELADLRVMNMAADDAVELAAAGLLGQRVGKGPDVLHGVLHLQ